MWIKGLYGNLINLDNVRTLYKHKQGIRYAKDGAEIPQKWEVRAAYKGGDYDLVKKFKTEDECQEYIDGMAELMFQQDFPAASTTQAFKDRWFGKDKS